MKSLGQKEKKTKAEASAGYQPALLRSAPALLEFSCAFLAAKEQAGIPQQQGQGAFKAAQALTHRWTLKMH